MPTRASVLQPWTTQSATHAVHKTLQYRTNAAKPAAEDASSAEVWGCSRGWREHSTSAQLRQGRVSVLEVLSQVSGFAETGGLPAT